MKICEWCKQPFEAEGIGKGHKKFCSNKCKNSQWHVDNYEPKKRNCIVCNTAITDSRRYKYCSDECSDKNKKVYYTKTFINKKCQECGEIFNTSKANKIYCSNKCCKKRQNRIKELRKRIKEIEKRKRVSENNRA